MKKYIIKIESELIEPFKMALARGKETAGVNGAENDTVDIVGNAVHISGDIDTVFSAGLLIGGNVMAIINGE